MMSNAMLLLLLLFPLFLARESAAEDAVYRINAGGPAFTDSDGNNWEADSTNTYFDAGNAHSGSSAISGTTNQALYQTERWGTMKWEFPLANGNYEVRLHFAEVYFTAANKRVFDVLIEDTLELGALDVFDTAGANTALIETIEPVTVTDDLLTIEFAKRPQNQPKISGIEIISLQTNPLPTNPFSTVAPAFSLFINAGGPGYLDSNGNLWEADFFFTGGQQYTKAQASIDTTAPGTTDQVIYRSERWYQTPMTYGIPILQPGTYEVTLHFAEVYDATAVPGARVFDILLEGETVLARYDITAAVGQYKATTESFNVDVDDGILNIAFNKVVENPKINGIEIHQLVTAPRQQVPSPTPLPPPSPITVPTGGGSPQEALFRVNVGGPDYDDGNGLTWRAGANFVTGGKAFKRVRGIAETEDDELYQTNVYKTASQMKLEFDDIPNGMYEVELHFAEIYFTAATKRIFNVILNGQVKLENYDIVASVGANTADVQRVSLEVSNSALTVEFGVVTENPTLSAIAIIPTSVQATPSPTPARVPPTPAPVGSGTLTPLYNINVGGQGLTDSKGTVWLSDTMFTGGMTYSNTKESIDVSAEGTSDEMLYETERYKPTMSYSFPVTNGYHIVILHFAEIYGDAAQPGIRVFDVLLEGRTVLAGYDITASVGPYTATTETFNVEITDGELDLSFGAVSEQPKLNGIQVFAQTGSGPVPSPFSAPVPEPEPTPAPVLSPVDIGEGSALFRINAGGDDYVDSQGFTWLADTDFVDTGKSYSPKNPPAIGATVEDGLYQVERWDEPGGLPMVFNFDVPSNESYQVRLHFAEIWFNLASERIFNVRIEGEATLTNYDIVSSVGANTADVITLMSPVVSDGVLSVEFEPVVENPKVNAIEIYSMNSGPLPTPAPVFVAPPVPPTAFQSIYINVGGDTDIVDTSTGVIWETDNFFNTGRTNSNSKSINDASFNQLYNTDRYDEPEYPNLIYSVGVPDGVFEVKLHFADTWTGTHSSGARKFDIYIEGALVEEDLDIFDTVGANTALVKTFQTSVSDGALGIEFKHKIENPVLSGIEIHSIGVVKPHYAHAVPGGPYSATDVDDSGSEAVYVDGYFSHTHAAGADIVSFQWKLDDIVVADGQDAVIDVPVGEHVLSLTVRDSTGDVSEDVTIVTVKEFGYPFIASLTPDSGEMSGGEVVTILGFGFTESAANTFVSFGSGIILTGTSDIVVVDDNTIHVLSVPSAGWGTVSVTVSTSVGTSNPVDYDYLPKIPLSFYKGDLYDVDGPTTIAFGPDGNCYVGTQNGLILRLTLNEQHEVVSVVESNTVGNSSDSPYRAILGIGFDPMDTSQYPKVYASHSYLYHGDIVNYNGKVSVVSGANLDIIEHVVEGLPVSDHDHGINGLEFDDSGNMYIQVGGNTNAGVEGALSQTNLQKEDYLSAATIIARDVTSPTFDGNVTYDTNRNQVSGFDVQVYAAGLRNSYDLVFHSNGRLYATDNGPNKKFGYLSVSCSEDGTVEPFHNDKLLLVEEGKYYGHPNRKRGETDARQCVWRDMYDTSEEYTGPIRKLKSSTNGICEFQSDHFGGELRGQLILARYKGALYNLKLTNDGAAAGEVDAFPDILTDFGGLDVTQGPDGTLFVARNNGGFVFYQAPNEMESDLLSVKSVFPRRGPEAGGTLLSIYGEKMFEGATEPNVTVGAKECPIDSIKSYIDVTDKPMQWIKCILPSGTGNADVVVSFDEQSYTFASGYRYITGKPKSLSSASSQQETSLLEISGIYLIDATSNQEIGPLEECDNCIDPTTSVSIRVDTENSVGSVSMDLSGILLADVTPFAASSTDNVAPYTLFEEVDGVYSGELLQAGNYSFMAQAHSGVVATGKAGTAMTVTFSVSPARRLESASLATAGRLESKTLP